MYEEMRKALAGAGRVAPLAGTGVGNRSRNNNSSSSSDAAARGRAVRGSSVVDVRRQLQALRMAADLARKHGAADDLMVGECEAVASELALTLAALGSLSAAVVDGSKATILTAINAAKAAGAGQAALAEGGVCVQIPSISTPISADCFSRLTIVC